MIASAAILLLGGKQSQANPPRYRIIAIDPVEEYDISFPVAINNRGEAVGISSLSWLIDQRVPTVWLPAARYGKSPGTHQLPLDEEATSFKINGFNADGFAVGRAAVDSGTRAWMWNLNTWTDSLIPLFVSEQPKDEAFDINDADPPVVVGTAFFQPWPTLDLRGFRFEVGGSAEELDQLSHQVAQADAISDSGFAVGVSWDGEPDFCGQEQVVYRTVSWAANSNSPTNLKTLGTAAAEALTKATGVNNANPEMIVGHGEDPEDTNAPCRRRGLFWANAGANPLRLPYLVVNGQDVPEPMEAYAIRDPLSNGDIEVVGSAFFSGAIVLWRRVNGVWTANNLNNATICGGDAWLNSLTPVDINSCGWILGYGALTNGSQRAFVLIPADACPGDVVGTSVIYPDGKVNINDLLSILNAWGTSNCISDATGDGNVNVNDLLAVLNDWGPCSCFPAQGTVPTFSQSLAAAGLSQSDWNLFLDVLGNGSPGEIENYKCWMDRYLTGCTTCPACNSRDPFAN